MASPRETLPLPSLSTIFPHLHNDPAQLPRSTDPFTITTRTGFLPAASPLTALPDPFGLVNKVLDDMPVVRQDGTAGLLAKFGLGPLIDAGRIPDLTSEVDKFTVAGSEPDLEIVTAIFRDYTFLASAYLLEPCWEAWCKDRSGGYGLGRQTLPQCIAGPLVKTAQILDIPAYMSYAASYALYNYRLVDESQGTDDYNNIRLIRAFEHGLDPKSSEAGFILTHIHMVSATADLVKGAVGLLSSVEAAKTSPTAASSIEALRSSIQDILSSMEVIEASMERMWSNSLPKDYISYRTFIFGITSQSMFPSGVVYEGQFDNQPQFFRGESGANDSIIPLLDYLCQVPMPSNPLTEILRDFKNYRPKPHRQFLSYVLSKATELGVREFCVHDAGHEIAALYLKVLDHVRSFRWRHWLFAREYIIKRSSHPTATGGSPIVTWLPNQLGAVMDMMEDVYIKSGLMTQTEQNRQGEYAWVYKMMERVTEQRTALQKEVRKYCEERGV